MNITFVEVIIATSVADLKKSINGMISKHRGTARCIDIKYEYSSYSNMYSTLLCFETQYYDNGE